MLIYIHNVQCTVTIQLNITLHAGNGEKEWEMMTIIVVKKMPKV